MLTGHNDIYLLKDMDSDTMVERLEEEHVGGVVISSDTVRS